MLGWSWTTLEAGIGVGAIVLLLARVALVITFAEEGHASCNGTAPWKTLNSKRETETELEV